MLFTIAIGIAGVDIINSVAALLGNMVEQNPHQDWRILKLKVD